MTPETIAKHTAQRVCDVFGEGLANVMDGCCGCGGNMIQFARKCGFCVGVDLDPIKVEYAFHNAYIYNADQKVQMVLKDFLNLTPQDLQFPEGRHPKIDVLYLSPPWGGTGYNLLKEYTLDHVFPEFNQLLKKALEFTNNLILFLPRNTSIDDLI